MYDDILFFKLFEKRDNSKESKIENSQQYTKGRQQYMFDVTCNNIDFQNISLLETLQKETLVKGRLAPGIEGIFDIILTTNLDTKYNLNFQSQNDKPQNLKFENLETKISSDSIDKLGIEGTLKKGKTKTITIHWYWNYENTEEGNIQDTIDSQNIKNYTFTIHATGEQIL